VPCWLDLWDYLKRFLPAIGLLAYIAVVAVLLWAPRLSRRWLRITSRVIGAAGAVPLIVLLPALFLALALSAREPSAKTVTTQSPDGQQATLNYQAGFLGRDYSEVTLMRPGGCRKTVFSHSGPSFLDDPKLEWSDNHHLRITYHTRPDDQQRCETQVGETSIVCTSLPWPFSSKDQPSSSVTTPPR
jgi:hypothetical protein